MQADSVFDGIGNPVKAGNIGSFTVQVASTPTPTPCPSPSPRPASQAQLLNISTRTRIQMGENVIIGGFIVTGNVAKKVILRGIGPSLTNQGVADAFADPVLELHASDGSIDHGRQRQLERYAADGDRGDGSSATE